MPDSKFKTNFADGAAYDPQKRIGVMISKLGASKAISVGAYAFALSQLDQEAGKEQ